MRRVDIAIVRGREIDEYRTLSITAAAAEAQMDALEKAIEEQEPK